jgi:ribosome-binding protein aMBF1 (putative translation factor)
VIPSPLGRVALLGIAQRQIRVKYSDNLRNPEPSKPLPASIKTMGDWIHVKRCEKNFTPGHLALKMGITAGLVLAWEEGAGQPNEQQLEVLAKVLGILHLFPNQSKRLGKRHYSPRS